VRITFGQAFEDGLRDLTRAAEQLDRAHRRVASGRQIERPSDAPTATVSAIGERASLAGVEAYRRATDAAGSRMAVTDTVLSDVINQITAAKVTALAAQGSGRTQAQRDAMSTELVGIRDAIFNDINTRFGSTYLFAGSASTTAPFTETAGVFSAYLGDATPVTIDVAEGRTAQVTFDGGAILQGSDAVHVLDALTALSTAVSTGDAAGIAQGVAALDRAFDRAVLAQTQVGIAQRTLDDARPQLEAARLGNLTRISAIEDANMAIAVSDLTRAEAALEAALSAFARRAQLSLMDFLR
jgi:flagellar hook-associated protein 3 FlgL